MTYETLNDRLNRLRSINLILGRVAEPSRVLLQLETIAPDPDETLVIAC